MILLGYYNKTPVNRSLVVEALDICRGIPRRTNINCLSLEHVNQAARQCGVAVAHAGRAVGAARA